MALLLGTGQVLLKVICCENGCDIIGSCWPEFKAPVNSGLLPVAAVIESREFN